MAEVIQKYETQLRGRDGRLYQAQATGRARVNGMWEGWLEFLPLEGGLPVVTDRETTQPNREDLAYWATGLTDPYLDGALLRALTQVRVPPPLAPGVPVSDAPRPHPPRPAQPRTAEPPEAVLDPFHVYAQGDDVLRDQLHALSGAHLRNIVRAYRLSDLPPSDLERLTEHELIAVIMAAVAHRASH
jgi:hypothetical protein